MSTFVTPDFVSQNDLVYTVTMIIGFDGSRAFVKNRTGTENYSFQLLKALSKIDKKNSYIVYVRDLPTSPLGLGARYSLPTNFLIKKINWSRLWTQAGLAIATFNDDLDLLFVPSHALPIIRKPGLKTVITVHDLGSQYLPNMHQLKQRLYLAYMQRHQLKTATKIIAVSNATKQDLIKKIGIEQEKISVVYEGFDNSLFKPLKKDIVVNSLKHYDLQPESYFLFVGTVQPRKNLERIIVAFKEILGYKDTKIQREEKSPNISISKYPNIQLVIVGSKGWLSDEIYKLPKQLGIENKVKFLGYVPDSDLPLLYSGAIAFLFPSLFEGFGLPILEAQACGCPVITSNISSMPEVAGKGALFVNPYSIDDIVKGMVSVKREAERVKLIKNGFENIKRFSWEKCAKETLRVFEEV